tara:strand:- start:480 stop:764 length:285 start_codon:yes stop_codon:yes gene_type:complete
METKESNPTTFLITIAIIFVTLFIPLPVSEQFRLIAIAAIFLLFIGTTLSNFSSQITEQKEEQKRLGEKLKIHEQLIDIKRDIEVLKEKEERKK